MSIFENSEITTILVVNDIDVSKNFYVDVLGAELIRQYGGDSLVLKFMNHWMLLVTSGGPTEDKPDVFFNTPSNKNEVSHSFTIRVLDCNSVYQQLAEKGVKFITPPLINGRETRCFFRDPDDHLFEISEYRMD